MARETLMTEVQSVASTTVLRQIAELGVLGGFARVIIIVRYQPFAKEPGLCRLAQEFTNKGQIAEMDVNPSSRAPTGALPSTR